MILTVTMNPSVDISYRLESLKIGDVNRCKDLSKSAGGKGLNVARVAHLMGGDVLATGLLGGCLGQFIRNELDKDGVLHDFSEISENTRNCISILEKGKEQTEILEAGPQVSKAEFNHFCSELKKNISKAKIVVASGSMARGVPEGFYQTLADICVDMEKPLLLDCSGKNLAQALLHAQKPCLIKPNLSEISFVLDKPLITDEGELISALKEEKFKGIKWIVVSMGADGAIIKYEEDFYRARVPRIEVVNAVGSGDSTVAGLALSIMGGKTIEDTVKTAMCAGILNALNARTGFVDMKDFDKYFNLVEVKKI